MVTHGHRKRIYVNQEIGIGQYELITIISDMLADLLDVDKLEVSYNIQTGNESF
mgnify:CR=1 FL=1